MQQHDSAKQDWSCSYDSKSLVERLKIRTLQENPSCTWSKTNNKMHKVHFKTEFPIGKVKRRNLPTSSSEQERQKLLLSLSLSRKTNTNVITESKCNETGDEPKQRNKSLKNPSTLQLNNRIRKLPAAVQKRKEERTKVAQEMSQHKELKTRSSLHHTRKKACN